MTNSVERQVQLGNVFFERLVASTEPIARTMAPMLKGASCANLELMSLTGRRAQAYFELPSALAQCRGPQDLLATQSRFWQAAFEDYALYSQRLARALGSIESDVTAPRQEAHSARERDTLTFPDVFNFGNWALPEPPQRRRDPQDRAA